MPTYRYVGKDATGKQVSDVLMADNPTAAQAKLATLKITGATLSEAPGEAAMAAGGVGMMFTRVGHQDLMTFYSALSIAINAGASLRESLAAYAEQATNPKLKITIDGLVRAIEGGKSFSEALKQFSKVFPNDFVSLVAAGEKAGNMAEMLRDYVVYSEKQAKIRSKAVGAMIYPLIMIVIALTVVIVLTTVIFPKFIESFGIPDEQLPDITRYVRHFSNILLTYWVHLLIGIPATFFLLGWLVGNTAAGALAWNWVQFNTPVFGTLMKKFYISRFVHVLGSQLKGGVPGLTALIVTREATQNVYFQKIVDEIINSIKAGGTYSAPLRRYPHIIPPVVTLMFSIGERSGAIGEVLEKIGNYYDDQVATATEVLVSLIEPVMIVVMGVLVSVIAVSMFLPIFNLTKMMK